MSDNELSSQIDALTAERNQRKWTKVNDLMGQITKLELELGELQELRKRITSLVGDQLIDKATK